jgi:hypothetical protein
VLEIPEVHFTELLVVGDGRSALPVVGFASDDIGRGCPGAKGVEVLLELRRPLGIMETIGEVFDPRIARTTRFLAHIIARVKNDRDRRYKVLVFRKTEETAEVVLGIANGMQAFALGGERRFDGTVEGWEGVVVVRWKAVVGVRTLKGLRENPNGRGEVFTSVGREGWSKVVMELRQVHRMSSSRIVFCSVRDR